MLTLPILMYHKVQVPSADPGFLGNYVLPCQFEEQLQALADWGFTTITIEQWEEIRARRLAPPEHPIALTFDDGYRSVYENAWPLLQRHGMTATVFLVTDYIGKTNGWETDAPQQALLSRDEIADLKAGGVSFGSHTCTHRALTELTQTQVMEDLVRSRRALESLLGRTINTFAYPYNKHNRTVRALVRRAGYRAATLGRGRPNARWTNPHALMRISVTSELTLDGLYRRMVPSPWFTGL